MTICNAISNSLYAAADHVRTSLNSCFEANTVDVHTEYPANTVDVGTEYPTLTRWASRLSDPQKQELRNLVNWLSFASYYYGTTSDSDSAKHIARLEKVSQAVREQTPYFPINRTAFYYNATDFYNIPANINHLLEDDLLTICCHQHKHNKNNPVHHMALAESLLSHLQLSEPQDQVKEITLEDITEHCLNKTFYEWPVEIKRLSLSTTFLNKDANLQGIDLTGIHLKKFSVLNECDLRNAKLENSILSKVFLRNRDLSGISFKGAQITDGSFEESLFDGVDFTNAKIKDIDLWGAKLDKTIFTDAEITLAPHTLEYKKRLRRDYYLNHRNNHNLGLLPTIHSISNEYPIPKLSLMRQVIQALLDAKNQGARVSDTNASFEDILFRDIKFYGQDPVIAEFMFDLLERTIQAGNQYKFHPNPATLHSLIQHALEKLQSENKEEANEWAVKNSAYINQLIYYSENPQIPYAINTELRKAYLSLPDIAPLAELLKAQGSEPLDPENFVLIAVDKNNKKEAIIFNNALYESYFINIEKTASNISLRNVFWYPHTPEQGYVYTKIDTLEQTFAPFPLLSNKHAQIQNASSTLRFIRTLNLGEFEDFFIQAQKHQALPRSLVAPPESTNAATTAATNAATAAAEPEPGLLNTNTSCCNTNRSSPAASYTSSSSSTSD